MRSQTSAKTLTTVLLENDLRERLRRVARRDGASLSFVIRRYIRLGLCRDLQVTTQSRPLTDLTIRK